MVSDSYKISILSCPDGFRYQLKSKYAILRSRLGFASVLDALTMASLHLTEDELWGLEEPAALFAIDSKQILAASDAHRTWLGYDPIGSDCDEVLKRLLPSEKVVSEVLPLGNRAVGMYRIFNAQISYPPIKNHRSLPFDILHSLRRFIGFVDYSSSSQEFLDCWIALQEKDALSWSQLEADFAVLAERIRGHL